MPEAWLRGAVAGIDPYLMPAAHALTQAREELQEFASSLSVDQLWTRPGNAASVGFHLRHVAGSIDRLLTYARGGRLDRAQTEFLAREADPGEPPATAADLIAAAEAAIERALAVIRSTPRSELLEPRTVGRAALPSNVIGLLFHIGEHTQRHAGQVITTVKVISSGNSTRLNAG